MRGCGTSPGRRRWHRDDGVIAPLVGKARQAVALCTARINLFEGSVRSGKTIASLIAWLIFVRTGPAGNLAMVGKTERTLKRNVIDPLIDMLGPKRCRFIAGSGELWLLGRRIYVAGANDKRAMDKIRGLTLVGAYVDEVTVIPESFWAMLLTRLSVPGAKVFGTTNPDGPQHWLMVGYLARARLWLRHDGEVVHPDPPAGGELIDLNRFSFRLPDNPSLEAAYVAEMEKMFVGLWRARFIEGLWVLAEGAIWSMWDEDAHVVDDLPPLTDCVLAADYGTAGVFAALLLGVGVDPLDGRERLYVAREWRWDAKAKRRQLTDAQYSDELRRWLATEVVPMIPAAGDLERTIVDPSATSFIAQLHRDGWERVRGADNAVADGIREVATLLAADRIRVHRSCEGLRREIPGYVWDPKKALAGEDAPVKANDHSCDAWRYGVRGTRLWWRHWITTTDDVERAA